MSWSRHAGKNREHWNRESDAYQAEHASQLSVPELVWGTWNMPEEELRVLGDVPGKDVLELGCGAAQWSIKLARRGARPVGLDISERQLAHARRLQAEAGVEFPLVHASAEDVPLPDETFDVVFCDWGTLTFADPLRTVPEAARLLRPGGLLAFCTASPLWEVCWDEDEDRVTTRLLKDYFDLRATETPEGTVEFQLPYGAWIRLLRENDLTVEDLIEPRPPVGATSTYRDATSYEWSRRWPSEAIWKARKQV